MSERPAVPLQHDMFSDQWVDARSRYQKQQDRERQQPIQTIMFPIADVFQIGVNVRPWLKQLPAAPLVLERVDLRTPEEIEQDLLRQAEALTVSMFAQALPVLPDQSLPPIPEISRVLPQVPKRKPLFHSEPRTQGYRREVRKRLIPLRERQDLRWLFSP